MSPVEAFAIRIKMKSRDPMFFLRVNQGIKMNTERLILEGSDSPINIYTSTGDM